MKTKLLALCSAGCALALLTSGCLGLAMPSKNKLLVGQPHTPDEIAWIVPGITKRLELVARFGAPSKVTEDNSFAAYWWLTRTGWYGVTFLSPAGGGFSDDLTRTDAILIAYSPDGTVRKIELTKVPRSGLTPEYIKTWCNSTTEK